MKLACLLALLLCSLCAPPPMVASAHEQNCPYISGSEKKKVKGRARWLLSKSLKKQVERRSNALGHLIAFEQCHFLETGLLSGDFVAVEGPFFLADGVPLKSLVAKYYKKWRMAVAPTDPRGKMPNPNLLEVTEQNWTLLYQDSNGMKTQVAAGKY